MSEYERDFKGVWIPKEVWLNRDLSLIEKVFLVEIDSLDNKDGCYASNKYFSEFFDISKGRCSQIINQLKDKGLISIEYEREGKEIKKRIIRVVNKLNRGSKNIKQGYLENDDNPIKNSKGGYLENAKESNTLLNNTSNNNTKEIKSKEPDNIPYKEIIDYLNDKADKRYRHTTGKTKALIQARMNESFTLDDFKKVIDIKTEEWKGDSKMNKFLRPETLFGTKFESYLNQPINNWKGGNNDEYEQYINME